MCVSTLEGSLCLNERQDNEHFGGFALQFKVALLTQPFTSILGPASPSRRGFYFLLSLLWVSEAFAKGVMIWHKVLASAAQRSNKNTIPVYPAICEWLAESIVIISCAQKVNSGRESRCAGCAGASGTKFTTRVYPCLFSQNKYPSNSPWIRKQLLVFCGGDFVTAKKLLLLTEIWFQSLKSAGRFEWNSSVLSVRFSVLMPRREGELRIML